VGAVIVLRRDGAALLQHRDDKPDLRNAGLWVPPGGHAEVGESILDCARRELREETEYAAEDLQFLLSIDDTVEGWPEYQLTIFWCWYDGIQPVACHEGQALAFIERSMTANYRIPTYLLKAWDAAFAAAGSTIEKVHL
jgi:8-oxo-dGTP pyrophosphatase MutT (NUDIX family)